MPDAPRGGASGGRDGRHAVSELWPSALGYGTGVYGQIEMDSLAIVFPQFGH
jgi:hypothetical protein